jgi:hypothetical protein
MQDAPGAETDALPKLGLRQQLHQRTDGLHRRDKKDFLPDGRSCRLPDAQPEHRRRHNLNAAFFCFIHVFLCSCSFSRFQNITSCMRIQSFIFSSLDMKVIKHYTGIK